MSASLTILAQHLLNGVLIGCAYALIAMGLTMIFGVMNIANFAHGEFYMLGGFVAFYLVSLMGLDYFAALPLAVAVVVVLAIVLRLNAHETVESLAIAYRAAADVAGLPKA